MVRKLGSGGKVVDGSELLKVLCRPALESLQYLDFAYMAVHHMGHF